MDLMVLILVENNKANQSHIMLFVGLANGTCRSPGLESLYLLLLSGIEVCHGPNDGRCAITWTL